MAEERIREISKTEMKKEKNEKDELADARYGTDKQELLDNHIRYNLCILGISEGEDLKKRKKKCLK